MVKQDAIKFRNGKDGTSLLCIDLFFRKAITNDIPTVLNSNSVDYSITINGQPYNSEESVVLGSSVAVTFNSIGSVKVSVLNKMIVLCGGRNRKISTSFSCQFLCFLSATRYNESSRFTSLLSRTTNSNNTIEQNLGGNHTLSN